MDGYAEFVDAYMCDFWSKCKPVVSLVKMTVEPKCGSSIVSVDTPLVFVRIFAAAGVAIAEL